MAITVLRNGSAVSSEIKFSRKSPWDPQPKITEHNIEGADYDIVYFRGRHSATCTLQGYFKRTAANMAVFNSLKDGSTLRVTDLEGTKDCICTSGTPVPGAGGIFVNFSMTLKVV